MLRLALAVVGMLLVLGGQHNLEESRTVAAEPRKLDLAELEAGQTPPSSHVQIGAHWRAMDDLVYVYEYDQGGPSELRSDSKLTEVYYPILTEGHVFFREAAELESLYGSWDQIPDEQFPSLRSVAVLVRTKRYRRGADIPSSLDWVESSAVQGMFVDERPSPVARRALQETLPELDLDRVLILEEGRRPARREDALMTLGAGGFMTLGALASLLASARSGRRKLWPKHLRGGVRPAC